MANQRAKNKKSLSGWVDESIAAEVKRIAKENKIPKSEAMEWLVREGMEVYKTKRDQKGNKNG
jgi:hypothetical protein